MLHKTISRIHKPQLTGFLSPPHSLFGSRETRGKLTGKEKQLSSSRQKDTIALEYFINIDVNKHLSFLRNQLLVEVFHFYTRLGDTLTMAISSIQLSHGFRSYSMASNGSTAMSLSHTQPFLASMRVYRGFQGSLNTNLCRFKGGLVSFGSRSRNLAVVRDRAQRIEDHPLVGDSIDGNGIDDKQVTVQLLFFKFFFLFIYPENEFTFVRFFFW